MKKDLLNSAGFFLVFLLFWVAVSGSTEWSQLIAGAAVALFVVYFNRNLLITSQERPPVNLKTVLWSLGYFFKLLYDIVRANFEVAWIVLHPAMPIKPNLVRITPEIKRPATRVLLANSITMTPGTLTVLADDDCYLVHALNYESADALEGWSVIKSLEEMERS